MKRLKNTGRGKHPTLVRARRFTPPQLARREVLGVLGAAGAALALGCSSSPTSASSGTSSGSCAVTPSETAGPFPSLTDLFRSDIREGRTGVLLTLTLRVVNVSSGCSAVSGANVEIWHCDVNGNYSQYGSQVGQTYLRGIQTTNSNGEVTFTTIYPGWYQGRATHIHVEVTVNGVVRKVSQMAFPESINNTVYASAAYSARGSNPMSNASDGILGDSLADELVTPTGSPAAGYAASWQIGI
jgi:protocatechuate 3,4-dioxygenase beta subunit